MRNIYKTIPARRLKELYVNRGLSYRDIAKKYCCDLGVVARALQYQGIAIRHPTEALKLDAADLRKLYRGSKLSTYKIASKYGCDPKTVYRYLKLNDIATRPRKKIHLTAAMLEKLYLEKKQSLKTIACKYGYSPTGILKKLKEFRIERRSTSEMNVKHLRTDYCGDLQDKSYLIGFRIGDLGVRQNGSFIRISTGTTKIAQSKLLQKMFRSFGPIWMSRPDKNGAINISISLNRSFSFLLPKHNHIPRWIMGSRRVFFAFLAGYTDAEGNICITDGRARFRIRSCDKGVLRDIHRGLKRCGVESLFSLDRRAGIDSRGVKLNRDFWSVIINEKQALFRLLMILLPLLRHQKRKCDAEEAMANVIKRLSA